MQQLTYESSNAFGLTLDSLKGQNLGFPLRPYLSNGAPFLRAVMACGKYKNKKFELKHRKSNMQTEFQTERKDL